MPLNISVKAETIMRSCLFFGGDALFFKGFCSVFSCLLLHKLLVVNRFVLDQSLMINLIFVLSLINESFFGF